ncbi:putative glycosyltransferase CsbB [compost metagenome]
MKLVTIVVPCYNEELSIQLFYNTVDGVLSNVQGINYDFIFVNDGSRDRTEEVISQLSSNTTNVGYINFSRNFGKEAAMLAGIEAALGDAVIIMDVDLQDPPSLLPQMIESWLYEDFEVIYTRRTNRSGEPPIRSWFAKKFYKFINKMSEVHIVDGARDFRLMDRKVVDNFLELKERNRFAKGLFMWTGFNMKCIEFENVERSVGQTNWSFFKLFQYAIDGIVSFSISPLRWATYFGFLTASSSFIYMFVVIFRKIIYGNPVNGYSSIVSLLLFFGGMQLIFMGIIGEYLGRVFLEVKARPNYVVRNQHIKKAENNLVNTYLVRN